MLEWYVYRIRVENIAYFLKYEVISAARFADSKKERFLFNLTRMSRY